MVQRSGSQPQLRELLLHASSAPEKIKVLKLDHCRKLECIYSVLLVALLCGIARTVQGWETLVMPLYFRLT